MYMVCMGEPSTEPAGLKVPTKLAGPEGWYSTPPAAGTAWSWRQRDSFQGTSLSPGCPEGLGCVVGTCLGVGQGESWHLGPHLDGLLLLLQAHLPLLLLLLQALDGQLPLYLQVLLWIMRQASGPPLAPAPHSWAAPPPAHLLLLPHDLQLLG